MTRRWTIWIIIVTAVLLIAWDVVAYLTAGGPATISTVMLGWIMDHPVVPFVLGVLGGHLCFPQIVRRP